MLILNQNNIVQITPEESSNVDLKYQGVIGFVKEFTEEKTTVSIYTPKISNENAYVEDVQFNTKDLTLIGDAFWKPI